MYVAGCSYSILNWNKKFRECTQFGVYERLYVCSNSSYRIQIVMLYYDSIIEDSPWKSSFPYVRIYNLTFNATRDILWDTFRDWKQGIVTSGI